MRNALAVSSRASAPTASPSLSARMSPRTSSLDGTACSSPSRSTVDIASVIDCNAATAVSALLSWTKPSTPLSTTIAAMTSASIGTPAAPSATQTATEIGDRDQQKVDQRILKLCENLAPPRHRRLGPQFVGSVALQTSLGLRSRKPGGGIDIQIPRDVAGVSQ